MGYAGIFRFPHSLRVPALDSEDACDIAKFEGSKISKSRAIQMLSAGEESYCNFFLELT